MRWIQYCRLEISQLLTLIVCNLKMRVLTLNITRWRLTIYHNSNDLSSLQIIQCLIHQDSQQLVHNHLDILALQAILLGNHIRIQEIMYLLQQLSKKLLIKKSKLKLKNKAKLVLSIEILIHKKKTQIISKINDFYTYFVVYYPKIFISLKIFFRNLSIQILKNTLRSF